ncbi:MAG TPA: hypothetical protein VKP67_11045 [Xanthobacteraceae bacterium]|nr:hypothetical protein [Xanthobacteraceae bacterium]
MVARTRTRPVPPPADPTIIVKLTRDAHEVDRRLAMPGHDAARQAVLLICGQEGGLVAGHTLRVVIADDTEVDGRALPPPRDRSKDA